MTSPLTPSNAAVGTDPFVHMWLAINSPERVLALRMAMARVIRPDSVVLDAGCGALGVLAILAAKLGAARVIGVDLGSLDLARALAEENGVADRVQFVQSDLHDVELPVDRFDVVFGMVYNNDIRMDLPQKRLVSRLLQRFGHPGTHVLPNRVRYSVAAYDPRVADPSGASNKYEWERRMGTAAGHSGMSFDAVGAALNGAGTAPPAPTAGSFRARWPKWWQRPFRRPVHARVPRYFDRTRMTLLTRPGVFAEIDFRDRPAAIQYPATTSLEVVAPGRLELVLWQQDLLFDDILIRSSESPSVVDAPQRVEPGDTAILSTTLESEGAVPLAVESRQSVAPSGR